MAEQGEPLQPRHPAAVAPVMHGRRLHQHLLIDAARALMLGGAATAVLSTVGSPGGGANAGQAVTGLLLWLLGVWLLALAPVARRFPRAALVGAATADAVLKLCFMPWN